jgi:small subunit ribosomal protein S2
VRHAHFHVRTQLTSTSLRCIQVIAGVLGRAGEAGQKQRLKAAARGLITYEPARGLRVAETEDGDAEIAQAEPDAEVLAAARTPKAVSDAEFDADADAEFSRRMDEVRDGEAHRQKGGRSIKFSD